MKINSKYSLIKIEESNIKDYFNNQVLCLKLLKYQDLIELSKIEKSGTLNFRKIKTDPNYFSRRYFQELFLNGGISRGIKKNGLIDISSNSNNQIIELNVCDSLLGLNEDEEPFNNELLIKPIVYINNIDYNGGGGSQNDENQERTFKILKYLKSKNIRFRNHAESFHADFSFMFNNEINNQVESIRIDSDFIEPINLVNVNKLVNLHTLSIPLHFKEMIQILSGNDNENTTHCHNGELLEHRTNLIQDWNKMIDSLLSSNSIKNLKLFNSCNCNENSQSYNEIKQIYSNGIKQLLSSKSTSLEYFKIVNMNDIISNDTFSELVNNKSIKTLVYQHLSENNEQFNIINYLIENVFSNDSCSVNHFKFSINNLSNLKLIFQSLYNNHNKIQLYSITIKINESLFNQVLNEINNLSNKIIGTQEVSINLKEFKIIIVNDVTPNQTMNYQSLLNNNNNNNNNSSSSSCSNNIFVITISHKKRIF